MTRVRNAAALLSLSLLPCLLSGCGAGSGRPPLWPAGSVELTLGNAGAAATDYRWGDIAGNVYSGSYAGGFSYDQPAVTVQFEQAVSGTLQGVLSAQGLKPNFAYQLKLEGQPTVDPWANEQIGYLGRWWSPVDGNVTDAYYEANKSAQAIVGYLLFDFLITDGSGSATRSFRVDSSYHVLWNQAQAGAPRRSAGPKQSWAPVYSPGVYASAAGFVSRTQTLFPEIQTGRPAPGKALLPAGSYRCTLVITEESFHGAYAGGGNWAAAMWHTALDFAVTAPVIHDVAVTAVSLPPKVSAGKAVTVTVTVANQGNAAESLLGVSLRDGATEVGTTTVEALAAGATANLAFGWTPSGSGTHLLTAAVTPLPQETDTADNSAARSVRVR